MFRSRTVVSCIPLMVRQLAAQGSFFALQRAVADSHPSSSPSGIFCVQPALITGFLTTAGFPSELVRLVAASRSFSFVYLRVPGVEW